MIAGKITRAEDRLKFSQVRGTTPDKLFDGHSRGLRELYVVQLEALRQTLASRSKTSSGRRRSQRLGVRLGLEIKAIEREPSAHRAGAFLRRAMCSDSAIARLSPTAPQSCPVASPSPRQLPDSRWSRHRSRCSMRPINKRAIVQKPATVRRRGATDGPLGKSLRPGGIRTAIARDELDARGKNSLLPNGPSADFAAGTLGWRRAMEMALGIITG